MDKMGRGTNITTSRSHGEGNKMVPLSNEQRLVVARVLNRYTEHRSREFCDRAVMAALLNWIQRAQGRRELDADADRLLA